MWYVCVCVTQKWNGKIHIQFQSSTQTQQYSNRNDAVINNCRYFSLFQMRLTIYFVIEIACSSCYIIPIFEVLEMHAESSASIYFLISFHSSKMCTIFCYETFLFVFEFALNEKRMLLILNWTQFIAQIQFDWYLHIEHSFALKEVHTCAHTRFDGFY